MTETVARDAILGAARAARPPAVARPAARIAPERPLAGQPTLLDTFIQLATAAGATVLSARRADVGRLVASELPNSLNVLSLVPELASTIATSGDPHALDSLDLFVCEAEFGVAENGAVWFATSDSWVRAALFLASRVVIVLNVGSIVADLHEAYETIDIRAHSFGAFVAGPSKTADIEQSLVIGAHGPKELTLIAVDTL
jgi:L-lactate dehydrogenase complex protein LldG